MEFKDTLNGNIFLLDKAASGKSEEFKHVVVHAVQSFADAEGEVRTLLRSFRPFTSSVRDVSRMPCQPFEDVEASE